ncbi:unnamed protein product [Phytomonas sp. Hart1]|nr:unnamed protein product [Phytomonas sp. Hart1]|eukprot:CCW66136.1 unnamed protein product [Phytomonas sp. isolate Hart1]
MSISRSSDLIRFSLNQTRIEKLVVCLGYLKASESACRGALASRVTSLLLYNCRPALNDIHDPDRTRLHARDVRGASRRCYDAYTNIIGMKGNKRKRRRFQSIAFRFPQTWDSEPVPDFMGLWCDRLLLGDHSQPHRVAVLEPCVPVQFQGEAITRVAQSHRHLRQEDVLVVSSTQSLPFGMVRVVDGVGLNGLERHIQDCRLDNSEYSNPGSIGVEVASHAIQQIPESCRPCSSLLIGVGHEVGLRASFTAEEEKRLNKCLIPLATFGCALWSVNRQKCVDYMQHLTPTPDFLDQGKANYRLWRTMQAAMLSTRDTALLNGYSNNTPLDSRLSMNHQEYLVQRLLEKLGEGHQIF